MKPVPALAVAALIASACSSADEPMATTPEDVPRVVSISPPSTVGSPATTTTPPAEATTTTAAAPAVTQPPPVETTSAPTVPSTTVAPPPPVTVPLEELRLAIVPVAENFVQPVLALAPEGDDRLFVVDQPGRIWLIDGGEAEVFLDIRDAVRYIGEQGLLGLAFHPAYADNGLFYVNFTDSRGTTVISEFAADPSDPSVARPGSRRDVMLVSQPAANHNGGMIAFGPDGLLWIGMGDGGGSNDRYRNGQRADRRLGSMLRIAVGPDAAEPFGDPEIAPFVASGGLPEVWAIGLRNPWRWSFDDGYLFLADVGQNTIEEINVVSADLAGANYGWPITEGADCFRSSSCDTSGLIEPAYTYTHGSGCSVTGGFVYRGTAIPELQGHYLFGDYCSGWIRSIVVDTTADVGRLVSEYEWLDAGSVPGLTSFGVDGAGEMYVTSANGTVYRIERAP